MIAGLADDSRGQPTTRKALAAFASGATFAVGLGLAGMTQPAKVIAFLDITGHWDPSLAFVMLGAIGVHATFLRLFRARTSDGRGVPGRYAAAQPTPRAVDLRLLTGAAIFGIGWGIAGFCPGPAVVSLVTCWPIPLLFVAAMVAGMGIHALAFGRRPEGATARALEELRS